MIKYKEIINTLIQGKFYAECSQCGGEFSLKEGDLFNGENFTENALELYQAKLSAIKEQIAELKKIKEQGNIRSESGAKYVNIGLILERLVPTMGSFKFNKNDCRSLFDPIDYIIFEGLSTKGIVSKIFLVEIKTGTARLNQRQKEIRQVCCSQKLEFKTYSV